MLSVALYWRLMLMILLLALGIGALLDMLFTSSKLEALHWKPTILWWLIGIVFWLISAISAPRLAILLGAQHLSVSALAWYQLSTQMSVTFMVLGILNPIIFRFSNHVWLTFKLVAVPLSLAIVVIIFARKLQSVKLE